MDRVPFNDLSRIQNPLLDRILKSVSAVILSGNYVLGPQLEKFESELTSYIGCKWAVGVATGTDALILSLLACGVGPSDTVLTMANAGSYTTVAARAVGAEPVFVDVSPDSLQMTLESLKHSLLLAEEKGISPKVVVVTHLFGQINSEVKEIASYAAERGILVIEDCAQAIGASLEDSKAGNYGDFATFSFFPTKNLGASGDAGAVVGKDLNLQTRIQQLRQYGWSSKYLIDIPFGRNSRLDEIQATILRIKLPMVDSWNEKRREIFSRYKESASTKVKFYSEANAGYVGHLCPITVDGMTQNDLMNHFESRGISVSIHFPIPDHRQSIELAYRDLVILPVTEKSCKSLVTIPMFPEMLEHEIDSVCKSLSELGI